MGRPTKLTPELQEQVVDDFDTGGNDDCAVTIYNPDGTLFNTFTTGEIPDAVNDMCSVRWDTDTPAPDMNTVYYGDVTATYNG